MENQGIDKRSREVNQAKKSELICNYSIGHEIALHYAKEATKTKQALTDKAVEMKQNQYKKEFLLSLTQEIEKATKDNKELDLSKNQELQDKIKEAEKWGVIVPNAKNNKFSSSDRQTLIQNIQFKTRDLQEEITLCGKQMDHLQQDTNRWLQMADMARKKEDEPKKNMTAGMK